MLGIDKLAIPGQCYFVLVSSYTCTCMYTKCTCTFLYMCTCMYIVHAFCIYMYIYMTLYVHVLGTVGGNSVSKTRLIVA